MQQTHLMPNKHKLSFAIWRRVTGSKCIKITIKSNLRFHDHHPLECKKSRIHRKIQQLDCAPTVQNSLELLIPIPYFINHTRYSQTIYFSSANGYNFCFVTATEQGNHQIDFFFSLFYYVFTVKFDQNHEIKY